MELVKTFSGSAGSVILAQCSTKASECGCKDNNGTSYQAHQHNFNIISKRKEKGGSPI